jgi:hypothetical protein
MTAIPLGARPQGRLCAGHRPAITDGRELRLRRVTEPAAEQKSLLHQVGLTHTDRLNSPVGVV